METPTLRRFEVAEVPAFMWLFEQQYSSTFCSLVGSSWLLVLERQDLATGPRSRLRLVAPETEGADEEGLSWEGPPLREDPPDRVALIQEFLDASPAPTVSRTRRGCMLAGVWWILDEYHGDNEGLRIAHTLDVAPEHPAPGWVGREVSGETRYDDLALARAPYRTWA